MRSSWEAVMTNSVFSRSSSRSRVTSRRSSTTEMTAAPARTGMTENL